MPHERSAAEFSNLQDDLENLKDDLAHLRNDLGDVMKSFLSAGRSQMGGVRDRLQSELKGRISKMGVQGEHAMDSVQRQLESRPMVAVGAAFGLGLILGALMNRNH